MKVYLSVDMEGVAGVNHPGPTGSGLGRIGGTDEERKRRDVQFWITLIVFAFLAGFVAGAAMLWWLARVPDEPMSRPIF